MKKGNCILLKFELLLILLPSILFSQNKVFDFALKLFGEGEYYRAISEFERYAFFFPNDKNADLAYFYIAKSYYNAKQYEIAARGITNSISKIKQNEFIFKLKFLAGESYLQSGRYTSALEIYDLLYRDSKDYREKAYFRKSWVYIYDKKWELATKGFNSFASEFTRSKFTQIAEQLKTECANSPGHRSPALSLMLSIIPGLGQIYCQRIGDGIIALCMVAASSYLTYYYYNRDNRFMTVTFSIIDIFFYSGNLYGAYNSARKYNTLSQNYRVSELKDKYWEELE